MIVASREVFPFLAADPAEETGRLLNSKKVSDHHAIIPTLEIRKGNLSRCSAEEMNVLILVAARLICAAGKRHVYETVKAALQCCGYSFTASGKSVKEAGWKAVEEAMKKQCRAEADKEEADGDAAGEGQDLSSLYQGAQFSPIHTKVSEHWTQPPKHYTEDTLLAAMERAGSSEMEADVERKSVVVQPASLARRHVVRIRSPRHRTLERRLCVHRARSVEHHDGIAGQFLGNKRKGAFELGQGIAMQERALDTAIQVMAGDVIEGTVPQVHADSLHVRDFHEVRIVTRIINPLLGGGAEPQRFRRLRRNKRTVHTLRKNRRQKTYDKNKKEPRSTAGMSIRIFSLVFRLSSLV